MDDFIVKKAGHMKRKYRRLSWILLLLLVPAIAATFWQATGRAQEQPAAAASGKDQSPSKNSEGMSEMFQGTVTELIDAGRHIYVRIDTGKQQIWVAVPSFDGKPGDKVQVPPGVPVADFYSGKLNRKFKMIIFVGAIRRLR
jgi:TOBE domain